MPKHIHQPQFRLGQGCRSPGGHPNLLVWFDAKETESSTKYLVAIRDGLVAGQWRTPGAASLRKSIAEGDAAPFMRCANQRPLNSTIATGGMSFWTPGPRPCHRQLCGSAPETPADCAELRPGPARLPSYTTFPPGNNPAARPDRAHRQNRAGFALARSRDLPPCAATSKRLHGPGASPCHESTSCPAGTRPEHTPVLPPCCTR